MLTDTSGLARSIGDTEVEASMDREDTKDQNSNIEVPRVHPTEPAEGAREPGEGANQPQTPHPDEPAEGER